MCEGHVDFNSALNLNHSSFKMGYQVHCTTTKGPLDIAVYENWSPHGTPRFIELVETGFFHSKVRFICFKKECH
jgi:hypothetical protein